MTHTSRLNFHFPDLIRFTISFWSNFPLHVLISGGTGYTCKMMILVRNKNTPTQNLGRTTANYQKKKKDTHTPPHSTTSCQQNCSFLPAEMTGWHIMYRVLLKSGWHWRENSRGQGKDSQQKGNCTRGSRSGWWPDMDYTFTSTEKWQKAEYIILAK